MNTPYDPAIKDISGHGRVVALDGLRGFAALIVVVFHYMAMLYPHWVPDFSSAPPLLSDTPLAVLWNGPFAVSIFFVLSGYVMAAAAERRHRNLVENILTRYLRLALPVVASVVLAWALLTLLPDAARSLAAQQANPSDWLTFTHQAPVPGLGAALQDGVLSNFISGQSAFNNVLWTMQVELVGSIFLFIVYWLGAQSIALRFLALAAVAVLGLLVLRDAYLCFVTGALLYEARKTDLLRRLPAWVGPLALVLGVLLGAPGAGFAQRWGLDMLPDRLQPGNAWGLVPVIAASLILLGVLLLGRIRRLFEFGPLQWLGQVSFALYLVHVPLLYTVIAWERVALGLPEPVIAAAYLVLTLALAHGFTKVVDAPCLTLLARLRTEMAALRARRDRPLVPQPAIRPPQGQVWLWTLLGAAALLPMTLLNGGVGVYYDSVVYLHRPEGFLRLLSILPFVDAAPAVPLPETGGQPGDDPATAPRTEGPRVEFTGRSMFYQIVAWTGYEFGRLWTLATAHAVMVAYPLVLVLVRVLGARPGWPFLLALGALGLVTPLGLFIGIAMPDILSGVLVLSVAAMMIGWDALARMERFVLFAIATFAMVAHTSHFLLGLVLPVALLLLPLRKAPMWRGAALVWLACLSSAGLETVQQTLQARNTDTVMLPRPHLTAHLVDDGPAIAYLQRACPEIGFEMCKHVDHLPVEWRDFLFGGTDPDTRFFADAPLDVQAAISHEQFALARNVLLDDPVGVVEFAARAAVHQLVRFDPAGGMVPAAVLPQDMSNLPDWIASYPDWMVAQVMTLRSLNVDWMLPALHLATWGAVLLSLAILVSHAPLVMARPELLALCAALVFGVVLNAAICGILASPYDRFQARIIWLVPLVGLAVLAARPMSVPRGARARSQGATGPSAKEVSS